MKNIIKFAFAIGLVSSAFAGKYGMAGCGIGSLVLGDQPGKIQIVAAIIDDAAGQYLGLNQTWTVTTGTSNCTESGVALKDREQDYFADANFANLRQEMAQGQGENLDAFASLFGCTGENSAKFSATMQKNYQQIFDGAQDGSDMLVGVRSVVGAQMAGTCSTL